MKLFFLSLVFVLAFVPGHAQNLVISGTIKAAGTGQPVPYVNIGIRKKNIGTASDENGSFTFRFSKEHLQDSLTFSAIGYREVTLPVHALSKAQPLELTLHEKATSLQEVVVKGRKMKIKKLGVTGRLPVVWGNPDGREEKDVYEFANLVKVQDKPTEVLSVHFYLFSAKLDSALFRINFYQNKAGLPGERVVEKSIIQKLSTKDGWVSIDLKQYDIFLTEDFFFGIEYLPAAGADRLAISLGGKLGGRVFSRQASLGTWESFTGASLTGYVTARQ